MMKRDDLERLAKLVERVPDAQFDMTKFGTCALGHAAVDPYFAKQGLKVYPGGIMWSPPNDRVLMNWLDAAQACFDLNAAEAYYLFNQGTTRAKRTPKYVAMLIRQVVRNEQILEESLCDDAKPSELSENIIASNRETELMDGLI